MTAFTRWVMITWSQKRTSFCGYPEDIIGPLGNGSISYPTTFSFPARYSNWHPISNINYHKLGKPFALDDPTWVDGCISLPQSKVEPAEEI